MPTQKYSSAAQKRKNRPQSLAGTCQKHTGFPKQPLNLIKNYIAFTIFHKNETNHLLLSDLRSNVHLLSLLCIQSAGLKRKGHVQGKSLPSRLVKYTPSILAMRSRSRRAAKNAALVVQHIHHRYPRRVPQTQFCPAASFEVLQQPQTISFQLHQN